MSDPNREGPFECCGPMLYVEVQGVYDGTCAYLCVGCAVWRQRFPVGDIERRALVAKAMPAIVAAHLGERVR